MKRIQKYFSFFVILCGSVIRKGSGIKKAIARIGTHLTAAFARRIPTVLANHI